jgi:hypothetical protein
VWLPGDQNDGDRGRYGVALWRCGVTALPWRNARPTHAVIDCPVSGCLPRLAGLDPRILVPILARPLPSVLGSNAAGTTPCGARRHLLVLEPHQNQRLKVLGGLFATPMPCPCLRPCPSPHDPIPTWTGLNLELEVSYGENYTVIGLDPKSKQTKHHSWGARQRELGTASAVCAVLSTRYRIHMPTLLGTS